MYGVTEVVLDFILCGVGNIFCDGFSNRRIPTCEFIAIVGGNGRCCRSVAAQFYTGCYIAFVILIGKIAVIAFVIGNGAFRSRALYAGDVKVASRIRTAVVEYKSRYVLTPFFSDTSPVVGVQVMVLPFTFAVASLIDDLSSWMNSPIGSVTVKPELRPFSIDL